MKRLISNIHSYTFEFKSHIKLIFLIILVININSSSATVEYEYDISYNPISFKEDLQIKFTPADLTTEIYFNSDLQNGYHFNTIRKEIMTSFFAPEFEILDLSISLELINYPYLEYQPRISLESYLVEYGISDNKLEIIQYGGIDSCCLYTDPLSSTIHSSINIEVSQILNYTAFDPVHVTLNNGTIYDSNWFTLLHIKNGYHTDQENTMIKAYQTLRIDLRVPDDYEVEQGWDEVAFINLVVEGSHDPMMFDQLALRFSDWVNQIENDSDTMTDKVITFLIWTGIGIIIYALVNRRSIF